MVLGRSCGCLEAMIVFWGGGVEPKLLERPFFFGGSAFFSKIGIPIIKTEVADLSPERNPPQMGLQGGSIYIYIE